MPDRRRAGLAIVAAPIASITRNERRAVATPSRKETRKRMNTRTRLTSTILVALAALVVGCAADPRAANNGNFERAINAGLAKPESRLCLAAPNLPHKILADRQPWNAKVPEDVEQPGVTPTAKLEALVTAGLAVKKSAKVAVTFTNFNTRTFQNDETVKGVPEIVYETGPDFSKYAVVTPTPFMTTVKLCFASLQVERIENFSEPGQAMGATVSSVYYRAKAVDVAPWSTDAAMRAAFPEMETDLQQATTTQRSSMVVLMSNGWQAAQ